MKVPSQLDVARLKKRLQPRSALALTLAADGIAISVVRLRLDGDGRDVRAVRTVPVSAEDVLKNPEKAGAVLGAALDAAGVREKRCAVCVPPGWALTASTDLPAVEPDDLRGFLELRAEREFPVALSELRLGHGSYTLPDGTRRATLAALASRRVEAVEAMLAAAGGRRAISISLALGDAAAAEADPAPTLGFLAAPGHTEVVVTAGGGVAALRSLPGPAGAARPEEGSAGLGLEAPAAVFDPVAFLRDIRITLGRLPPAVSQGVRFARFGGDPASAVALRRAIGDGLWRMGIEALEDEPSAGSPAPDSSANATAERAVVLRLRRETVPFEFVVFQPHRLEAFYTRYNTRLYRRVAAGLACLILLPAILFFVRGQYEGHLSSQWDGMRDNVADLDGLQQKFRRLRPWFDPVPVTVGTLEKLFGLFPEGGDVWAKSIQVNGGLITCTGFARNQKALLDLTGRLSDKKSGFSAVALKSQRGENPIQFTLTCQGGGPS